MLPKSCRMRHQNRFLRLILECTYTKRLPLQRGQMLRSSHGGCGTRELHGRNWSRTGANGISMYWTNMWTWRSSITLGDDPWDQRAHGMESCGRNWGEHGSVSLGATSRFLGRSMPRQQRKRGHASLNNTQAAMVFLFTSSPQQW